MSAEIDLLDHVPAFYDNEGRMITRVYVETERRIEDNSFDYAGTHCTGGRSGTHTQIDRWYEAVDILGYEWETDMEAGETTNNIVGKLIHPETAEQILEHCTTRIN